MARPTERRLFSCLPLLALLLAGPGWAGPLLPATDHSGENHSFDNHRGEDLHDIILDGANLFWSDFRDVIFTNASLIGTSLLLTRLDGAILDGADLSNANLLFANLTGASLTGVTLAGTTLRSSNLSATNFSGTDFANADLRGANLGGASLTGADLSAVNADASTNYNGATYDWGTQFATGFDPVAAGMILVPEPTSFAMLLLGLAALAARQPR